MHFFFLSITHTQTKNTDVQDSAQLGSTDHKSLELGTRLLKLSEIELNYWDDSDDQSGLGITHANHLHNT